MSPRNHISVLYPSEDYILGIIFIQILIRKIKPQTLLSRMFLDDILEIICFELKTVTNLLVLYFVNSQNEKQ